MWILFIYVHSSILLYMCIYSYSLLNSCGYWTLNKYYYYIYHFMLHCPVYIKERSTIQQLQQPYIEDENQILGTFLFEKAHIDKKKEELYQLWRTRQRRLKTRA